MKQSMKFDFSFGGKPEAVSKPVVPEMKDGQIIFTDEGESPASPSQDHVTSEGDWIGQRKAERAAAKKPPEEVLIEGVGVEVKGGPSEEVVVANDTKGPKNSPRQEKIKPGQASADIPQPKEVWRDFFGMRDIVILSVDEEKGEVSYLPADALPDAEPVIGPLKSFQTLFRRKEGEASVAAEESAPSDPDKKDPKPEGEEIFDPPADDDLEIPPIPGKEEKTPPKTDPEPPAAKIEAGEPVSPPEKVLKGRRRAKKGVVSKEPTETTPEIIDAEFEDVATSKELVPLSPEEKREALEAEVVEARKRFAEADLKHRSAWKEMGKFFRFKNPEAIENPDLTHWRTEYEAKLQAFRDSEIERLRESGLTGKKLEHEIKNTILYFHYDEVIALAQARDGAKQEGKSLPEKALAAFENLGNAYNKLSWKKKLLIAGGLFGAAGALTLTAGAAGGAVAGAALLARKFVVASGTSVTMETFLKTFGDKLVKKNAGKQVDKLLKEVSVNELEENNFSLLSEFLDRSIQNIDRQLQNEKQFKLFNKTLSLFTGFAATFGVSALLSSEAQATPKDAVVHSVPEGPAADAEKLPVELSDPQSAVDAKAAQEYMTASPEEQAQIRETTGLSDEKLKALAGEGKVSDAPSVSVEAAASPEAKELVGTSSAEAATSEVSSEVKSVESLRIDHPVTASDGSKGLWGVLDSRLPENMPQAERVKVISSMENAIAAKLQGMSPEQLKAVGFSSGDINVIRAGDTLKLGELLSPEETKSILEGKIVLPVEAEVSATEAPAPSAEAEASSAPSPADVSQTEAPAPTEVSEAANTTASEASGALESTSSPEGGIPLKEELKGFFQEHKDLYGPYVRSLTSLRENIMATPEIKTVPGYDMTDIQNAMNNTVVNRAMEDFEVLEKNPAASYGNPDNQLFKGQMERLDLIVDGAQKNFGEVGKPKIGETVAEYTQRITYLLVKKKLEDPSFRFKL